ncbi:MAG: GLUG motif-containing protein [Weeksellaceae bacterium]|nr:GLUG motif-containing protein [Weeksellaceae bacterium]
MKKTLYILMIISLGFISCKTDDPIDDIKQELPKGTGTIQDPYLIYTVQDLKNYRDSINLANKRWNYKSFKLVNDLDFANETDWMPIGIPTDFNNMNAFAGNFDGNNKEIRNIKIGNETTPLPMTYAGVFGYVKDAIIQNLTVNWKCINTTTYKEYVGYLMPGVNGGIVAYLDGGTIKNCSSSGKITGKIAGGIAGYSKGEILNCTSGVKVNSINMISISYSGFAGGIVGQNEGNVSNCTSTGDIMASAQEDDTWLREIFAGGIAGYQSDGVVVNSVSEGKITSDNINNSSTYAGGIIGYQSSGVVCNCFSKGDILSKCHKSNYSYSGGIVGYGFDTIQNCYSISNVKSVSNYTANAGGISTYGYVITNNLALNKSLTSVSNSTCNIYRISLVIYRDQLRVKENYARVEAANFGTSETSLSAQTDFTDKLIHGVELTDTPVNLLNNFIASNKSINGITLRNWVVKPGVNNGLPVFE